MKKFLSLMLAILMLVGAVPAMAETMAEGAVSELAQASFVKKYLDEGQRLVTNISIEPGIVMLASVDEEMQTPLQDLLQALTIQVAGQKADGDAQGALRLYLGEDVAADAIVAVNQIKGIYAASSFLGDTILQVTPAQMKELVKAYAQQMIAEGRMTQEQYDTMAAEIKAFREDPQAAIKAMIGDPDPSALISAVYGLLSFEMTPEALEAVPEDVDIDAKYVVTIPLKKDALKNVTTELAKLIWSMPVVQRIAPSAKINDHALTEESLINALSVVPDALAEDLEIRLYLTEDLAVYQAVSDVKLNVRGSQVPMKVKVLIESTENGMHTLWSMKMDLSENSAYTMTGDMLVTPTETGAKVTYEVSAEATENDTTWNPIYEMINADVEIQENGYSMDMEMLVRAKESAESDPLGLVFTASGAAADLGDHAEEAAALRISIENIGDVVTISADAATDLAEAYITVDDAVQPLAMSEEEQSQLGQRLTMNAVMGVMTLVQKLPESVQPLAQQLLGMQ